MAKVVSLEVIEQLVKASGIKADKVQSLIDAISEQAKESFGHSANPPKEIDGVTHYFCRYTAKYYPKEEMVFSAGKSKGYSKVGISAWNKVNAAIKKLDSAIADAIAKDDIEQAKSLNANRAELKDALNNPDTYSDIVDGVVKLHIL